MLPQNWRSQIVTSKANLPMELQIIKDRILVVRGYRVMLDRDLAELYSVDTKVLKHLSAEILNVSQVTPCSN